MVKISSRGSIANMHNCVYSWMTMFGSCSKVLMAAE